MRIRIATQNIQHGAQVDESGTNRDRWPLLLDRLRDLQPDILMLNECRGWTGSGHRLLARAQKDLGMYAAPLPESRSGLPSLILFRPDTMGFWERCNNDLSGQTLHGFTTVTFPIPGLSVPITFAAGHLDPYSIDRAVIEADLISTRAYRYGPLAVFGGDINYPPAEGPDPDYTVMRPYNQAARTLLGDDGVRRPNRRVGKALEARGYLDAALHLYHQTGDQSLLAKTASDDRIDRIYVSEAIGEALSNHQRLNKPAGASDHDGVAVDVETDDISRDNLWTYK